MTLSDRLKELLRNQLPYAGTDLPSSPVVSFLSDLASRVDAMEEVPFVFSVTIAGDAARAKLTIDPNEFLVATVEAQGGAATTLTWTSSADAVASVTAGGEVSFLTIGTAVITATSTFDGTKSDSVTYTVT